MRVSEVLRISYGIKGIGWAFGDFLTINAQVRVLIQGVYKLLPSSIWQEKSVQVVGQPHNFFEFWP